MFLEQGVTVKGKPFKDFLDINNHAKAIDYMMDLVDKKEPLSERYIKEFNSIFIESNGGRVCRRLSTLASYPCGVPHIPPQPYLITKWKR